MITDRDRAYVRSLSVTDLIAILGAEARHANTLALLELAVDAAAEAIASDELKMLPREVEARHA